MSTRVLAKTQNRRDYSKNGDFLLHFYKTDGLLLLLADFRKTNKKLISRVVLATLSTLCAGIFFDACSLFHPVALLMDKYQRKYRAVTAAETGVSRNGGGHGAEHPALLRPRIQHIIQLLQISCIMADEFFFEHYLCGFVLHTNSPFVKVF